MATYLDREQIRHRRAIQRRYDADQQRMASLIAFLLMQYARFGADGKRTIPTDPQTRLAIKAAIWAQVLKPYYIGQGTDAFDTDRPQSPFATLVRDGVEGSTRIVVDKQVSLLHRYIKDAAVISYLTQTLYTTRRTVTLPPVKQNIYKEPFYAYVDGNGYRLNDRIIRNSIDARTKLNRFIDYHLVRGSTADEISSELSNFLTISGRASKKPYGDYGSYAPWRMLRGEMLVAAGRATVIASLLNPVVDMVQWRLARSHSDSDQCDENAIGGPNGDGTYRIDSAPAFPNHPNCACSLVPVTVDNPAVITADLRAAMERRDRRIEQLRGALNPNALTNALMNQPAQEYAQ